MFGLKKRKTVEAKCGAENHPEQEIDHGKRVMAVMLAK